MEHIGIDESSRAHCANKLHNTLDVRNLHTINVVGMPGDGSPAGVVWRRADGAEVGNKRQIVRLAATKTGKEQPNLRVPGPPVRAKQFDE